MRSVITLTINSWRCCRGHHLRTEGDKWSEFVPWVTTKVKKSPIHIEPIYLQSPEGGNQCRAQGAWEGWGTVTLLDPPSTASWGSRGTGRRSKEVQSTLILGHLKMATNEVNFKWCKTPGRNVQVSLVEQTFTNVLILIHSTDTVPNTRDGAWTDTDPAHQERRVQRGKWSTIRLRGFKREGWQWNYGCNEVSWGADDEDWAESWHTRKW